MIADKQILVPSAAVGKTVSSISYYGAVNDQKDEFDDLFIKFVDGTYLFIQSGSLDMTMREQPTPAQLFKAGIISQEERILAENAINNFHAAAKEQHDRQLLAELKAKYESEVIGACTEGSFEGTDEADAAVAKIMEISPEVEAAIANIHETDFRAKGSLGSCGIDACITHGAKINLEYNK